MIESDFLGDRPIPEGALYGIHTVRAQENFPLGLPTQPELFVALAKVKKAAAMANTKVGHLDPTMGEAILQACNEIIAGQHLEQCPLSPIQGGAGTSFNMNINEVIANRASEILGEPRGTVHPLDHINLMQSTNDVFPTAVRIAVVDLLRTLENTVKELQEAFQVKEQEFSDIYKVGRTQLMDAVPLTLGNEFGAYAEALSRDRWRIYTVEERLRITNLGGTAIGTGLNADRRYIFAVTDFLRQVTGLNFARAENTIDLTQNADTFAEVSGCLKSLAVSLTKISNDLRLLASGPEAGLGEITLPPVQVGSSAMPGKINPVMPELINQVALRVMGNDLVVTMAASAGQLELNAMLPVLAHALIESLTMLNQALTVYRPHILGITANRERCEASLNRSWASAAHLIPVLGYDTVSGIIKQCFATGKTVREIALNYISEEEFERMFQLERLSRAE
jgi:aspartate ammonia-lyase